jgi:hypothetical protein
VEGYIKATALGVLVGLLAEALWVVGILFWAEHFSGTIHVSVNARPVLLVAFLGFVVGFFWKLRRTRHWVAK